MASVYILYSESKRKYYVGSCQNISERFDQHTSKFFNRSFTSIANDWINFLSIEGLSYRQARDIERHIKKMKSRVYIENLKKYPELVGKLRNRF